MSLCLDKSDETEGFSTRRIVSVKFIMVPSPFSFGELAVSPRIGPNMVTGWVRLMDCLLSNCAKVSDGMLLGCNDNGVNSRPSGFVDLFQWQQKMQSDDSDSFQFILSILHQFYHI